MKYKVSLLLWAATFWFCLIINACKSVGNTSRSSAALADEREVAATSEAEAGTISSISGNPIIYKNSRYPVEVSYSAAEECALDVTVENAKDRKIIYWGWSFAAEAGDNVRKTLSVTAPASLRDAVRTTVVIRVRLRSPATDQVYAEKTLSTYVTPNDP